MNLLLDTNVLLLAANGELPKDVLALIESRENTNSYSVAAIWEIVIKVGTGKLKLNMNAKEFEAAILSRGYKAIAINSEHAHAVSMLKDIHRDPFDRIMIAQALVGGYDFVTCDAQLTRYGSHIIYYARQKSVD